METTMQQVTFQLPKSDVEFFEKLALKMGWTHVSLCKDEEPSQLCEEAVDYQTQTKAEIMKSVEQACKELKLFKEGKLKTRPVEDLLNEMH